MADTNKNTNKAECTELPINTNIGLRNSKEIFSKTDKTSTKSYNLVNQDDEVEIISNENYFESVSNLTKPLNASNNDKHTNNDDNILNDVTLTKDVVISIVDSLLNELKNDVKVELTTPTRPEVQNTFKEDDQINTKALKSVITNEHWSKKDMTSTISHDLEDQREEVEFESDNFKSILNPTTPLYANNNTDNKLNNIKQTKDDVISAIDSILIDMNDDVKVKLTTLPLPGVQKTHKTRREGVRMNTTALRREMHIKNRLQKK